MGNHLTIVDTLNINGFEPVILKKYENGELVKEKTDGNLIFFNVSISYNRHNKYIQVNGFVSVDSDIQRSSVIQLT